MFCGFNYVAIDELLKKYTILTTNNNQKKKHNIG